MAGDSLRVTLGPEQGGIEITGRLYAGPTPAADTVVARWSHTGGRQRAAGLAYLSRLPAGSAPTR